MKVAAIRPRPRVAFLAEGTLERHVPRDCPWAEVRAFPVAAGGWGDAARAAASFAPEVSVVLGAAGAEADALALLPGIRIGVVAATLPLPVDTGRSLPAPALDRMGVVLPAAASPPASVLERIERLATVAVLEDEDLPARLSRYGILLRWSDRSPEEDAISLQALADGLLLVTNRAFPETWGIEPEDEYLLRPSARAFATAVESAVRAPEGVRAVRVRAWQKAREAFDAGRVFERLVHDALLEADAAALIGRVRKDDGA